MRRWNVRSKGVPAAPLLDFMWVWEDNGYMTLVAYACHADQDSQWHTFLQASVIWLEEDLPDNGLYVFCVKAMAQLQLYHTNCRISTAR